MDRGVSLLITILNNVTCHSEYCPISIVNNLSQGVFYNLFGGILNSLRLLT